MTTPTGPPTRAASTIPGRNRRRMGGLIAVAPGIKWLRMPLPFRLDHINLYLLEDGEGWTVVDAGIGLDRTRELMAGRASTPSWAASRSRGCSSPTSTPTTWATPTG